MNIMNIIATRPHHDSNDRHLGYLDGLRGIAAMYVVAYHAVVITLYDNGPMSVPPMFRSLMFGHYAVSLFIVVSGFCLMLPIVRSPELALRGGYLGFFKRRARRILPPYYAGIAICFALPILESFLRHHQRPQHWLSTYCIYAGRFDVLAHILLVHNLSRVWCMNILPPFWSVAAEWQIYFLFAFLLLPILRRWGTLASLIASVLISFVPSYFLRSSYNLAFAFPWYVVLFAIGMIGAVITRIPRDNPKTWRQDFLLRLIIPCIVLFLALNPWTSSAWFSYWTLDLQLGVFMIWIILESFHQTPKAPLWTPRRLLELPPLLWLGRFSYSIYLIHYLVLIGVVKLTAKYQLAPIAQVRMNLEMGIPMVIVVAWLFHLVFERPFLRGSVSSTMPAPSSPVTVA